MDNDSTSGETERTSNKRKKQVESEGEASPKRLRSAENDLEVTVGRNDGEQRIFWHNAVIMAYHSNYVDAMLASPMVESKTKRITFPDIDPSDWELLVRTLDHKYSHRISVDEALKLVKLYDQYAFEGGKYICDRVLKEAAVASETKLERQCHIAVASVQHGLEETKKLVLDSLQERFEDEERRVEFEEHHLQILRPIFNSSFLLEAFRTVPGLSQHENLSELVKNDLFPDFLARTILLQSEQYIMVNNLRQIILRNAGFDLLNGYYKVTNPRTQQAIHAVHRYHTGCSIYQDGDKWLLGREAPGGDRKEYYKAKIQTICPWLPPRYGWDAVNPNEGNNDRWNELETGPTPILEYIFN